MSYYRIEDGCAVCAACGAFLRTTAAVPADLLPGRIARAYAGHRQRRHPELPEPEPEPEPDVTCSEAGRRGGAATSRRYGPEFYARIGRSSAGTTVERHGVDFFARIGALGGNAAYEKLGHEHYSSIGRRGGEALKEQLGVEHFVRAGRSAHAPRLTAEQVDDLVRRHAEGASFTQLAREIGSSRHRVSRIVRRAVGR